MKYIAALTFALTATTAFAADGTFDKTLNVSGAPSVSVATGSGYVHVYAGSDSQVHIIGHVHAHPGWTANDVDARIKQILAAPPVSQSGNTITVGDTHGDNDLYRNITIDYDVTTPRSTALKANTGSGDLQIGGIEGVVNAHSGSGEIKAENIGSDSVLEAGSGSIHASKLHGPANVQTGSGTLDIDLTGAGDVKAHTGSGSIHINGINGALRAGTGSGSIEATGSPTSEWRLETGSGSIRLNLGSSAKFNLNAETGSGTVHIEQPILMQGSLSKHHVSGAVNGGGPTIRVTTGSGDVSIH
jgi:Putative adhesin